MNPKIQKVCGEIDKVRAKIAEQNAKLRDLERQKTELENAEIIAIFRKQKLTEDQFSAFVQQTAARDGIGEDIDPASDKAVSGSTYFTKQEDTDDEN